MRDLDGIEESVGLAAGGAEPVPGWLQLPRSPAPVAGVLLLHGFTSRKEDMATTIGRALFDRGVASLAIDLPMHGRRIGSGQLLALRDPRAVIRTWKQALREAAVAITHLAERPGVDAARLGIAGYSLGAYLSVIVAASDPRIRAVALTAGGDLPPSIPFLPLIRTFVDPRRAVRALAGRPLLMMNGTRDRRIPAASARALFDAAVEPKEQRWYDGGHWPPPSAAVDVAAWLATQLGARPSAPSSPPGAPADSSRARPPRTTPRSRSRTRSDPSR